MLLTLGLKAECRAELSAGNTMLHPSYNGSGFCTVWGIGKLICNLKDVSGIEWYLA